MTARHVLIGGGTGFIGRRLSQLLSKSDYKVTAVSRKSGSQRISWQELQENGIPRGVTAVVNLAGQNVLNPSRRWTDNFKQNVWDSRIKSTSALVQAIQAAPDVKVFVNISGVSHYKPDGQLHSEYSPVQGYDFMSRLCLEWEKAATIPSDVNCRSVKIRTGVVVGRDGGVIQSILLPFKLGLGGPMGTGQQPMPWIHIEDLCRLIQFSIEKEDTEEVINAVAPHICTNGEFCQAFAGALHRPSFFSIPEFVVNLLFGKDRSALLLTGAKVEPKKTLELGFRFNYPTTYSSFDEIVNGK